MKHLCCRCPKLAIWRSAPSSHAVQQKDRYFCDDHVSRGCSCNIHPDTMEEDRDELGRLYPCCDYLWDDKGFDDDQLPPRFPPDRWVEKHLTPARTLGMTLAFTVGAIALATYAPTHFMSIFQVLLGVVCLVGLSMMGWMFYWECFKYPTKPQFCKECGHVLPPKYKEPS